MLEMRGGVCVQKGKDFLSTNRCWLLSKEVADTGSGSDKSQECAAPNQYLLAQRLTALSAWTVDMTKEITVPLLLMGNTAAQDPVTLSLEPTLPFFQRQTELSPETRRQMTQVCNPGFSNSRAHAPGHRTCS